LVSVVPIVLSAALWRADPCHSLTTLPLPPLLPPLTPLLQVQLCRKVQPGDIVVRVSEQVQPLPLQALSPCINLGSQAINGYGFEEFEDLVNGPVGSTVSLTLRRRVQHICQSCVTRHTSHATRHAGKCSRCKCWNSLWNSFAPSTWAVMRRKGGQP